MKNFYVIDIDCKRPEVMIYGSEQFEEDEREFGIASPLELQDDDYFVFEDELEAETWLWKYETALASLTIWNDGETAMRLRRRYLATILMGEKRSTIRGYDKKWPIGKIFRFTDQTFSLTVKLRKIVKIDDKNYRYEFSL